MMTQRFCCVWHRGVEVAIALIAMAFSAMACGETAIKGVVIDRITQAPLSGAVIEVRRGGEAIGHAVSDTPDGSFLLTVEVANRPEATNLKLFVTRDAYMPSDEDLVIVSARPKKESTKVLLLSSRVADCLSRNRPRWVVVGHFRPPLGKTGDGEFAQRVTDALRWELAKIAQTSSLAVDRRPAVVPCDRIDEREFLSNTANELKADALLSGGVSQPPNSQRFTVTMFLGDQHGLFRATDTKPIISRDVDLEDPSASRLDASATASILQALLTGYLKEGAFEECVELGRRAAAEWRSLPRAVADVNADCVRKLPAQGLRGGTR